MLMPPDAEHNRTNRVKLSDYGRPRRMIRLLVERESEEEALALAESGEEALYDDGKMLPYVAPELIQAPQRITSSSSSHLAQADVWSLGCILASMGSDMPLVSMGKEIDLHGDGQDSMVLDGLKRLSETIVLPDNYLKVAESCSAVSLKRRTTAATCSHRLAEVEGL